MLEGKQTHAAVYPRLNSSAFQAYPDNHNGNHEKCILEEQETVLSNEMCILSTTCSHIQHISSSTIEDTHKIFGKEVNGNQLREKREIDGKDNKRNQYFRGHCSIPGFTVDLNNHMGQSPQTAFSLPANCTGKPTWLRATWSPSIEDENSASLPKGKLKGQFREGTIRTLFPLQGDFNQLTFQTTPNSPGDLSCGSELVRSCNNPTA